MKPVSLAIVGAGSRGVTYAEFARLHPDRLTIVGVAEPREFYRQQMALAHHIPAGSVYADWRELAAAGRNADAVVVATPDQLHADPAVALLDKGYHVLLEKPMAPSAAECRTIIEAAKRSHSIFAVCHVLRYTPYTRKVKEIIDTGRIGQVVSLQHLEPVGYWHQAHSFVRGNWRKESESSFMLLAKSCHDLDWIRYIMGEKCTAVSSFGALSHFREEEKPAAAGDNCLECDYEPHCPYSARKIYLDRIQRGETGWPVDILVPEVNEAAVRDALGRGPYGRCVYDCDNDVVDHQVVNMQFEGGQTATFTMTAFTEARPRQTRIFGTRGELHCDGRTIRVFDFLTDKEELFDVTLPDQPLLLGHGGGDYGLMDAFVSAIATGDTSRILSGAEESLESHLMVFAAEQARLENRVVSL